MSEVREFTHDIDKSKWGPGPWTDEPDKIHWIDPTTDLDCLMHRNGAGAWCGYVGVTEGHPAFEVDYDYVRPDGDESYIEVHGGLTYAAFCQDTKDESRGVCHVPFAGRPHRVWWLGFDCAHSGDVLPSMERSYSDMPADLAKQLKGYRRHDVYRDRAYVEAEVARLAAQLKAMAQK